ncbi:MAG: hypothetical protein NC181_02760 [Clostridium sp.]|nr:hypothetical protein [Clostridium sp.]MCM1444117.1 hypothetical protein [Candidatus Amulumruptor caecigallinarius]
MKFVDKIKNMFTEEVEEERPTIKKEVTHVEINTPKIEPESVPVEEKNEEEPKQPEKAAPIFFDDKDFDTLEKPKPKEEKSEKKEEKPSYKDKYKGTPAVEVKQKTFKPSPIISPVYGILDKNYKKEDIEPKTTIPTTVYTDPKDVTIDTVRQKAYGTLEDDIETTMFGIQEEPRHKQKDGLLDDLLLDDDILGENQDIKMSGLDDFDDFEYEEKYKKLDDEEDIESKHGGLEIDEETDYSNEDNLNISEQKHVDESTSMEDDFDLSDDIMNSYQDDEQDNNENISDSDLFDLIDSMYEKSDSDE